MRLSRNALMWMVVMVLLAAPGLQRARAQASAIQSGAPVSAAEGADKGRKLLALMVEALGGEAWLHRKDWTIEGHAASFYKGAPNPGVTQFEDFHRTAPFAERVEIITKMGVFIATAKRDIVEVWTPDNGYEVTYRGKKELPKDIVTDYERRRLHSLEQVAGVWLQQPGTDVVYEGTSMVARHLADKISVLNAKNDTVTIELDAATHLPLSRSFEWRNETYKDHDSDREEYDDYHMMDGFMTALTITRFHNGDMASQRYYTKVSYNTGLAPTLFDPDKVLVKKK